MYKFMIGLKRRYHNSQNKKPLYNEGFLLIDIIPLKDIRSFIVVNLYRLKLTFNDLR